MRACAKEKKNYLCGTKPGMMRVLGGAVYRKGILAKLDNSSCDSRSR